MRENRQFSHTDKKKKTWKRTRVCDVIGRGKYMDGFLRWFSERLLHYPFFEWLCFYIIILYCESGANCACRSFWIITNARAVQLRVIVMLRTCFRFDRNSPRRSATTKVSRNICNCPFNASTTISFYWRSVNINLVECWIHIYPIEHNPTHVLYIFLAFELSNSLATSVALRHTASLVILSHTQTKHAHKTNSVT